VSLRTDATARTFAAVPLDEFRSLDIQARELRQMSARGALVGLVGAFLFLAACGGGGPSQQTPSSAATDSGKNTAIERIHSRYLISEFEKDKDAAAKRFRGKVVIFEAFVDQHGTNDQGPYVRVKSEPFAARFIYCYYDSSQAADLANLESGSVVFLMGRIGEFADILLLASECQKAQGEMLGGGTKGGG